MTVSADEIPSFDGQLALQHIARQLAFGPRTVDSAGKQDTLEYIRQQLEPVADNLVIQTFTSYELEGSNLWATFRGSEDTSRIMLGAHWDTRPVADKDSFSRRNKPVPGANDGASGVAVLLEIARLLAIKRPSVTVDLVFFDLEDMGKINGLPFSIGAKAFVNKNHFYRPSAGIVVDMVCDKNLKIPRELHSQTKARSLMNRLWQIAERQKATAFKNRSGGFIKDDHLPFLQKGIPVVNLIHYPFPIYWHTTSDTFDKCSSSSLQQVGNVIVEFLYSDYPP